MSLLKYIKQGEWMQKLVFWELNEINFDYVKYYINKGKLPNWKKFIEEHGLYTTISEKKYEELEPWIQWPTVRTGMDYAEHGVFRLGDMEGSAVKQHWEILEEKGYSVAAISPINGANNTKNSPFWIPDPWTHTKVSGDGFVQRIAKAVTQAVNDNAQEKLEVSTIIAILEGLLTKTQLNSWTQYLQGIAGALKKQHWSKAVVLDRLLADVFIHLWKKYKPDFSTLFLNAGAHIQHHYMYNSAAYRGKAKNPSWYIGEDKDPLIEILELYDRVLHELQNLENVRLMISVGMQQVPYEKTTFYWRFKDHSSFLKKIGIHHKEVQPLMTRDFLIKFDNKEDLLRAEAVLNSVKSCDGVKMFEEIDKRDGDLFVTLTYPNDIEDNFSIFVNEKEYKNFKNDIVFVAIKNGHHHTVGYYLDSGRKPGELNEPIPLKNLYSFIMENFSVENLGRSA